MNDLTKEARARAYAAAMDRAQQMSNEALQNPGMSSAHYGDVLSSAQSNIDQSYGRPKYGNDYLEPDRPLTGKPRHYLTGYEGSRCDRLDIQNTVIPDHICGVCYYGKDTSCTCSRHDCPEREEARTGINLDKINRVSDDYRKISDEVDNEIGE